MSGQATRPPRRRYQTRNQVKDAVDAEQRARVEARQQAMAFARAQVRARANKKVQQQKEKRDSFIMETADDPERSSAVINELQDSFAELSFVAKRPSSSNASRRPPSAKYRMVQEAQHGHTNGNRTRKGANGGPSSDPAPTDFEAELDSAIASLSGSRIESSGTPDKRNTHRRTTPSTPPLGGASRSVPTPKWEMSVQFADIKMGDQIGQGGQGTVFKAEWCGTAVAIKKVFAGHEDEAKALQKEASILSSLRHPRIVLLVGACFSSQHIFLVSELICGPHGHHNLRQILDDTSLTTVIRWPLRVRMASDVAQAMHYLHTRNMVHRDLKSANVLVTEGLRCKVADFGMSRVLASGGRGSGADGRRTLQKNLTMKFNFGGWIAPEVITGRAYDSAVDVWAFGVLLCELVTGLQVEELPRADGEQFAHMGIGAIDEKALKEILVPFEEGGCPNKLVLLATACTKKRSASRPATPDINGMLNVLSSSLPCPDLLDLQQSVAEIAVLEQELLDYVGRLRVHQEWLQDHGHDANADEDHSSIPKPDLRLSNSFVANTEHIMQGILPKLHAKVEKANELVGPPLEPDKSSNQKKAKGSDKKSSQSGKNEKASKTCLVM